MLANLILVLACVQQPATAELELLRSIELPAVDGRIDHLALHAPSERLYIAALANDTVEVVDTAQGVRLATLREHSEPQGAALIAKRDWIVVSDGGGAGCRIYEAATSKLVRAVELGSDCDNVRYDEQAELAWVAYGGGGLVAFEPATGAVKRRIELGGHPESFQLAAKGTKLFANVPPLRQVVVVDRVSGAVEARWKLDDAASNYPLAFDEMHARLFVGCRQPAKLLVLDSGDGRRVATLELSNDVDDLFLDARRERLYAICGEGLVDVFDLHEEDHPARVARIATRAGARTGLWVAERSTLYVAAPKRGDLPAALLELRARP